MEIEVAKRLAAEREKEEAGRIAKEKEQIIQAHHDLAETSGSLPSGVLTPLLKKHKDLDDELRTRLHELERKLWVFDIFFVSLLSIHRYFLIVHFLIGREQSHKETSLVDVLSPVSKKKTGRAYVSLARAYSEKLVILLYPDTEPTDHET